MVQSEKPQLKVLMILGYSDRKTSIAQVCDIFNEKYLDR